jgi:hypothetical protein
MFSPVLADAEMLTVPDEHIELPVPLGEDGNELFEITTSSVELQAPLVIVQRKVTG